MATVDVENGLDYLFLINDHLFHHFVGMIYFCFKIEPFNIRLQAK